MVCASDLANTFRSITGRSMRHPGPRQVPFGVVAAAITFGLDG